MSVYTFLEIDVLSLIDELRSFLKENKADISLERSQKGVEDDLHQIIGVCDVVFTEEMSNTDIENLLNSIVSVLVTVPLGDKTESLVTVFCEKLAKSPTEYGCVCLHVLNLLFQALPENLSIRYHVFYTMVKVAGDVGQISHVYQSVEKVKTMLSAARPAPSTDNIQQLLRVLHKALLSNKMSDEASKVMLELLSTYTEQNASQARDDAHRCIISSLADPNTYIMDHLLSLKPVKFLEGEVIHELLTIFVSEKLPAYIKFYEGHKDYVASIGLDHKANIEKMRLLTFLEMAETMKEMSFSLIQEELQIEENEVEEFIIRVLKTNLLTGRINQCAGKIIISSAVHRKFGRAQWESLKETLMAWQSNLSLVKDSMQTIANATVQIPAAQ